MKTSLLSLLLAISLFCSAHEGGNFVSSDMLASMKPGEKAALLMVHFGTTHDDTRTQTIDAINAQARKAFPDLEFREAYTSRIVIRRLKTRGVVKNTPLDALLQLRGEGYTHIIVQSTNIIDGVEMESLRRDVESVLPFFKEIRVGTPLLYSVEDAKKVTDILGQRLNASVQQSAKKKGKEHFDGPHMEVTESGYFQHIVHLTVCSSTGRISAMPYQYEVFFTLFFALCCTEALGVVLKYH